MKREMETTKRDMERYDVGVKDLPSTGRGAAGRETGNVNIGLHRPAYACLLQGFPSLACAFFPKGQLTGG